MKNIKVELKNVILDVMLPETETYLEELNKAIDNKSASEDEIDAREDIVSFIEELKTILEVISEDKLSDEDAKNVYEKITTMLEEHE